ncbi:TatD family hydrolase [Candidatus Woesearchaeota archaeon]|nr:TatD family hydrolase [Candidatus Woesearchaeota archaeon]
MLLIDTHAHLDLFDEKELNEVLERASRSGVKAIVTNGVDVKSNRLSLELAKKHSIVKPALGLYPIESLSLTDEEIDNELVFIEKNSSRVFCIGEVGLDYLKTEDHARQKDVFTRQIMLARKLGKALNVHSRKAESDAVELLDSCGARKVVMHCCMAGMKTIRKAVDCGFYFSVPALLLRSSHFRKLVETVPSNHLLTETDAPFLSPFPGRKSEPSMIAETVREIAAIKGVSREDCANMLFSNYQRLFV